MSDTPRVFVALDFSKVSQAEALIEQLDPAQCGLKVGKELFVRSGPDFVKNLVNKGYQVFLDLKFHDIPNTVAAAVKSAADLGVAYLTLHASGGSKMLTAAVDALTNYPQPPKLLAVTVLTSLSCEQLAEIGVECSVATFAGGLTKMAYNAGIRGFVCSPHEVASLKQLAPEACFVTPGIRLTTSNADDQTRIMTPDAAISSGADFLVIGRPITQADDPMATLKQINELIKETMK